MAASGTTNPRAWRNLNVNLGLVNFEAGISPLLGDGEKLHGNRICPVHRTKLKQQHLCEHGEVVEEAQTGYLVGDTYVTLDENELHVLVPESDKTIKLNGFVDEDSIDPMYYEKTYNIWPKDKHHAKGFDAIAYACRETGKVAVGTCTFTKATRLVVFAWSDKLNNMALYVVNYNANVRWNDVANINEVAEGRPEPEEAIKLMAVQMVETLTVNFNDQLDKVRDDYNDALRQAVENKAAGIVSEPAVTIPHDSVPDLMAALKATIDVAPKKPTTRKKKAVA